MLRTRWYKIAFAVLALGILLFAASFLFPATYDVCAPNDYSHAKECAHHHFGPMIFLWLFNAADLHNGLLTAFATVLLAFTTLFLWNIERHGAAANEAQLRAYVSGTARGLLVEEDKKTVKVLVEIRNSGQTPAFNVRVPSDIAIATESERLTIPREEYARNTNLTSITLAKDAAFTVAPKMEVSYATNIEALAFQKRLYVRGLITYIDVFGKDQWAEFCHFLDPREFTRAFTAGCEAPLSKVEISFKVPSFGNETSFNPAQQR